jgi:hypothetical protein
VCVCNLAYRSRHNDDSKKELSDNRGAGFDRRNNERPTIRRGNEDNHMNSDRNGERDRYDKGGKGSGKGKGGKGKGGKGASQPVQLAQTPVIDRDNTCPTLVRFFCQN